MLKGIKKYFKKSIRTVNYELKCEKLEKKLEEANDRIKFLEKELDRNYQNEKILYLQRIIKRQKEINENLRQDNLRLMKRGK